MVEQGAQQVSQGVRALCARVGMSRQNYYAARRLRCRRQVWARTLWQDSLCTVIQGVWPGLCTFGQEVEGLEAAAPTEWGRAALLNL